MLELTPAPPSGRGPGPLTVLRAAPPPPGLPPVTPRPAKAWPLWSSPSPEALARLMRVYRLEENEARLVHQLQHEQARPYGAPVARGEGLS